MIVSLIGLFIVMVVALVIGVRWIEKSMWIGVWSDWRLMFPGYREAAALKGIADKLKVYSDGQDESYEDLLRLKLTRDREHAALYHRVYDVDGLEAQVKDLKRVLEWTRTRLNDAKQEVLSQMGEGYQLRESIGVHKDVLRDYRKEMRHRATTIRQLTERIQTYLRGKTVARQEQDKKFLSLRGWVIRNPSGYTSPVMKIRKKRQVLDTRKRK